jgi:hypothetical protein
LAITVMMLPLVGRGLMPQLEEVDCRPEIIDARDFKTNSESTQAELALLYESRAASMLLQLSAPFSFPNMRRLLAFGLKPVV